MNMPTPATKIAALGQFDLPGGLPANALDADLDRSLLTHDFGVSSETVNRVCDGLKVVQAAYRSPSGLDAVAPAPTREIPSIDRMQDRGQINTPSQDGPERGLGGSDRRF